MTAPSIPNARDRVVIDDKEYEVFGEPRDMCHGPFWMGAIPMPTPYTVGLRAHSWSTTVEDDYGNEIQSWSDPVPLDVCGWESPGPTQGDEPGLQGHDRVVADLELLLPGWVIRLKRVEG